MVAHARRHVAEVGGETNLDAFRAEGEANRIDGIMRNGKRHDLDVADAKAATGREMFRLRQLRNRAFCVAYGAVPGMMRRRSQKDRDVQLGRQPLQPGNMVGVLVRNQDRGNVIDATIATLIISITISITISE